MAKDNSKPENETQSSRSFPIDVSGMIECDHLQVYHPVQGDLDGAADQSWNVKRQSRIFVSLEEQTAYIFKYERNMTSLRCWFCVPMSNVCWYRHKP